MQGQRVEAQIRERRRPSENRCSCIAPCQSLCDERHAVWDFVDNELRNFSNRWAFQRRQIHLAMAIAWKAAQRKEFGRHQLLVQASLVEANRDFLQTSRGGIFDSTPNDWPKPTGRPFEGKFPQARTRFQSAGQRRCINPTGTALLHSSRTPQQMKMPGFIEPADITC